MSLLPSRDRTTEQLKEFGLTMSLILCLLAVVALWRGRETWIALSVIAIGFGAAGVLVPETLRTIDALWAKLGGVLGLVMSHVILVIMFFLVLTPLGFMMRLFGKDLLDQKIDPKAKSYWIAVDRNGPSSRPNLPY